VQATENIMTITSRQDQLLLATLGHVPFDGWSQAALRHAEHDLELAPGTAHCLFPRGIPDVLAHLEEWANLQMESGWAATPTGSLKVREKVALAVRLRLTALSPYREALRRLPGHAFANLRGMDLPVAVWHTCDRIWRLAGDTATDFNYYTKRGLLASVYSATLLYWLRDESDAHTATWAFLDRRLQDVMQIPKLAAPFRRACTDLGHLAAQMRAVVRPRS
jgi:ubiquinone biosynthesis protein COQ9